jgi:hypothetical protein
MEIYWKVSDGFEGHPEHKLDIPDDEFEGCDTTLEIENIIDNFVRDEFDRVVGVNWRIGHNAKDNEEI